MISSNNSQLVRVGIAGLGRSGWNIHARQLQSLPECFRVTAVTDAVADRLTEANGELGCQTYTEFDAMLADDNVDLIVVATPNPLHTEHSIAAMRAGKHVVCEKPFALSVADADRAIAISQETGKLLAPFQNRRFEPHFLKVKELIDSGELGRILQIRMVWHGFTRRWDWQTLKQYGGGLLNNNGAHLLDQALTLLNDDEPEMFVDLQRGLSSGDTEDHIKVVLRNRDGMTMDVELTNVSAYQQDRWHVCGTNGGLTGSTEKLQWKTVDWDSMPDRPVQRDPVVSDRTYNQDEIHWTEHHWQEPSDAQHVVVSYYRNLHAAITENKPLFVTPESVRQQIRILNRCHELCPRKFEIVS
ncbi:MAG: oxidoreductase [Phycisphaeraceae bacterium]|nr:oxidoreductase [Phycisphaeraceae bacterium]